MSVDCVLVGFNEIDFGEFARSQQRFSDRSAAFSELQTNSVLLGDTRYTYMDLLNRVRECQSGRPSQLSAFSMPSLGVAYLANYLVQRGYETEIVNFFNHERDAFAAMLAAKPRAVAITTTYYVDDEPIRELIRFVRGHAPDVPIIIGGPRVFNVVTGQKPNLASLQLKALGADIYIYDSQGEATLAQVLDHLREGKDLSGVPNLIYRDADRSMQRTLRRPEANDLNENAIDWSRFTRSFYTPTTYMRTSRSCSFGCAFCNYPSMAGDLTLMDVDVIEQELIYLAQHGTRHVIFVDDTFNVPLPRFKEILRRMIADRLGLTWVSFFRCSNADDEAFELMAESGCIGVFLGIESGDQRILKNMTKFARLDRYRYGIERLSSHGILTLASLILGFPGETEESVANTLAFINETKPTFYNVQVYYHDVLAPVEKKRDEYGIEGSGYSWAHSTMTWQEAVRLKEEFIVGVDDDIALLPLYGLSIWALPYLLSQGYTLDQAQAFAKEATRQLKRGLRVDHVDPDGVIERLARTIPWPAPGTDGPAQPYDRRFSVR